MDYSLVPPEEIIETSVRVPLSKSLSARHLVINALAGVDTKVQVAVCDDTRVLAHGLKLTDGVADVLAAGSALRFLTAFYAVTPGTDISITGTNRLCKRPVATLVNALRELGADIQYEAAEGYAPLHITGRQLAGGEISVDASVSSQVISALMLVAPTMRHGLKIRLEGQIVSMPYIKMTAEMMRRRGAEVDIEGNIVTVYAGQYDDDQQPIEGDWSAASYWYALTAMSAGWVTVKDLYPESLQGDSAIADIAERLGVITEFTDEGTELSVSPEIFSRLDLDMSDTPDLVQTLAVVAPLLGVPFRFTGVSTLHDKECDRVNALCNEMRKLGIVLDVENNDTIAWEGDRCPIFERPVIDTYHDHRMAMAFAAAAIYAPGIIIKDVEVVNKSYPRFWDDLRDAGFTIETQSPEGADA